MSQPIPIVTGASARVTARVAGAFYLVTTLTAIFADMVVRGNIIISGNAAATAENILKSEFLYRVGFGADLIADATYVVVTALLYALLKPVNRNLSLAAAFLSLTGCAIGVVAALAHITPLLLLGGASYLDAFSMVQLRAMALFSLKFHSYAYNASLIFFGFYCVTIGYLIFRSTYFPRLVGALMTIAGFSLLLNSFALFLSPALYTALPDALGFVDLTGEAALMLWLLIAGVNVRRWEERTTGILS
jgi:hypothetical protein